ncbi:hypothetical protein D0469_00350 [Peribacillus saganii]|uniref:Uncharacterized protein n=1 Tax=Peribacillus saganii TaxID=2303992 RepID=A0A372LTU0_9BACI|nr:hypothetical protein D0469_00350 [Peribacillus saganii]
MEAFPESNKKELPWQPVNMLIQRQNGSIQLCLQQIALAGKAIKSRSMGQNRQSIIWISLGRQTSPLDVVEQSKALIEIGTASALTS